MRSRQWELHHCSIVYTVTVTNPVLHDVEESSITDSGTGRCEKSVRLYTVPVKIHRRLADGNVHCAGSATYQICFRLPIPNRT